MQSQVQIQQQRQVQTTTLQQMQLSHLLELPVDAMEEEIQNATDENPALEREEDNFLTSSTQDFTADTSDMPEARRIHRSTEEGESYDTWAADEETDSDILLQQIAEMNLSEQETQVMTYLAGSLTDNGYLEKDDATLSDELAFGHYIYLEPEEIHRLVALFQTLDPAGIGAHNLQECIALQLERRNTKVPEVRKVALGIATRYFEDYLNHRWERLRKVLKTDDATLQAADAEIRRCNPRPGTALSASSQNMARTISPDFLLNVSEEGAIDVELAWGQEPRLKVSSVFQDIVSEYATLEHPTHAQQESYIYAKDKVDRAQSYIDNLRRRRDTLLRTMREIARRQHDFFAHGDDDTLLQPMKLQDIAEKLGVDISTISRAANSKYVQTPSGIYPLRKFFNAQTIEKDGQQVSSTQVKVALREIIEAEDPKRPLPDDRLAALLAERGYKIARRTVAKYRDQMGILPNKLRGLQA